MPYFAMRATIGISPLKPVRNLREVANTEVVTLENAPAAYKTFSDGSPKKFVIDPHNALKMAA
jgi:hypothetical protein